MLKHFSRALLVAASLMLQQAASAADISVHDVYQAAQSGHLREAQQMMQQVLHEHPESAKAHYVEAELYAQAGQLDYGRRELKTAQRLDPTLAFAQPAALDALEARLSGRTGSATNSTRSTGISWGLLLLGAALVLAVIVFVRSLRQRSAIPNMAPGFGGNPTYGAGYGASYGPGYNPGPYSGGGMGSGIMGGLATGAAIGAGMVAGEALASHFVDGEHREAHSAQPLTDEPAGDWSSSDSLGGDDFGISDNSSWDSGGDIGGDWS